MTFGSKWPWSYSCSVNQFFFIVLSIMLFFEAIPQRIREYQVAAHTALFQWEEKKNIKKKLEHTALPRLINEKWKKDNNKKKTMFNSTNNRTMSTFILNKIYTYTRTREHNYLRRRLVFMDNHIKALTNDKWLLKLSKGNKNDCLSLPLLPLLVLL